MSPLALEGLVKRVIGGHWGQSPRLAEMASENKIEAYNFPQGIMAPVSYTHLCDRRKAQHRFAV